MVFNVVISIRVKLVNEKFDLSIFECNIYLGNCWFIAGAGAVTLNPDLLQRVVPSNQSFDGDDYAGI